MESLAIEECHGVLSEIATIPDRTGEDEEGDGEGEEESLPTRRSTAHGR